MDDSKHWRGEQVMPGIIPAPDIFKDKQRRYQAQGFEERDAEAWAIHDTVKFFLERQASFWKASQPREP